MPIMLNGTKYVGGYMNGQRVNAYMNGSRLFNYTTTVYVTLTNPWDKTTVNFNNGTTLDFPETQDRTFTQTLYNVPTNIHTFKDLYNYGLEMPTGYNTSDQNNNAYININGNPNVNNYIFPIIYKVTIYNVNTHMSWHAGEINPGGYNTCYIGYGCSFSPHQIMIDGAHSNYGAGNWAEDMAAGNDKTYIVNGDMSEPMGIYGIGDY